MKKRVTIVTLAFVEAGRMLLVRKRGLDAWILPGGKPEAGEDDHSALSREIEEELGCRLDRSSLRFIGLFSDASADNPEITVDVRLYAGDLYGEIVTQSEIEEMIWYRRGDKTSCPLAPSLDNQIMDLLALKAR